MKSKLKVFTEKQIIYSWIFGTMMLASLMVLINNLKIKKDIPGSFFFFFATFMNLIYHISQNNHVFDLFIWNQLSSLLTIFLVIILMNKSSYKESIRDYDKYKVLTVININIFFLIFMYSMSYNVYKFIINN